MRAAVYDTLLDEQESCFRADADQSRCRAARARSGADIRGILRATGPEALPPAGTVISAGAETGPR